MKSILIIGLGRFGSHIARKLNDMGHEVMAVDSNEERINNALDYVTSAQIGDSTNRAFLESLDVGSFDSCIVAIGDNFQNSLETAWLLKELGARKVIARASSGVQEKFLLRNGADQVVYPEKLPLGHHPGLRRGGGRLLHLRAVHAPALGGQDRGPDRHPPQARHQHPGRAQQGEAGPECDAGHAALPRRLHPGSGP